jgi:hypothetical protein
MFIGHLNKYIKRHMRYLNIYIRYLKKINHEEKYIFTTYLFKEPHDT